VKETVRVSQPNSDAFNKEENPRKQSIAVVKCKTFNTV
jgi:hypothetical protein